MWLFLVFAFGCLCWVGFRMHSLSKSPFACRIIIRVLNASRGSHLRPTEISFRLWYGLVIYRSAMQRCHPKLYRNVAFSLSNLFEFTLALLLLCTQNRYTPVHTYPSQISSVGDVQSLV